MVVREFFLEDRDTFLQLCDEFYNSQATLRPFDSRIAQMTFDRIMDRHENLWGVLLFDEDTVVGYSLITSYWCNEEGGNVIVLDELYIQSNNRHKGYATLFMQWLTDYFKDKAVAITLEVLTSNQNALSLYSKEGFAPDGFTTYTKRFTL